jgi:hypothetical protein
MKKIFFGLFALTPVLWFGLASATAPAPQHVFPTEDTAQGFCPADTVVWLNTSTGVYHFKGQKKYGNTKNGAYVCTHEADAAGDRPAFRR